MWQLPPLSHSAGCRTSAALPARLMAVQVAWLSQMPVKGQEHEAWEREVGAWHVTPRHRCHAVRDRMKSTGSCRRADACRCSLTCPVYEAVVQVELREAASRIRMSMRALLMCARLMQKSACPCSSDTKPLATIPLRTMAALPWPPCNGCPSAVPLSPSLPHPHLVYPDSRLDQAGPQALHHLHTSAGVARKDDANVDLQPRSSVGSGGVSSSG